jgi:hypothetical protein
MGWERAGVSGGTPAFFCLLSQSTSSPSGAACLRCQSNTAKPLCFSLKLPGLGFSLSRNILRIIALYSNSWFFAISSGIGLRPFAAGVGLGERTRPRVRRLTPRQPRPRAPPRVAPAWPGTRDFGISPANRRRAGFPTCVPWSSRNGCERGCAPQATGFLLFGHNMPLNTARNRLHSHNLLFICALLPET